LREVHRITLDEAAIVTTTELEATPPSERRLSPRLEQTVEVGVFLFLIVPSMVISLFAAQLGNLTFTITAISTIFRDLGLVALILFFLWRNGESLQHLGWTLHNFWGEVVIGFVLFVPTFFFAGLVEQLLRAAGLSAPTAPQPSFLTPSGTYQFVLATILVLVVAIAEETIFRGYLSLRFHAISGSMLAAILLTSFVFALGHGYEGEVGVITVGVVGLVLALVYVWRGSLIAPVTMHFLQDFLGIVLVPLLTHH
jgi:membrane protease YdiL (CAAX protease family)